MSKFLAEQFEFNFSKRDSVANFYNKEGDLEYWKKYDREHGKRLDFIFDRYNFKDINNQVLHDFGGGYGYFLKKFDKSNSRRIFDGASIDPSDLYKNDINYFIRNLNEAWDYTFHDKANISFCFEVLEHLPNLYQCICSIKELTKIEGKICISIPHEKCTHNTLYPGLFYPESNFEQFLGQMALDILDKNYSDHSFPSWIYLCENRHWNEKRMKWPKQDKKYIDVSPLDMVNL
jgi:Methyltransferase domain